VYWPSLDTLDNLPDRIVFRLVFEVNQVTDSAGSTWSTVTKRGYSMYDSNYHYERKIVLHCDGDRVFIPYDFYSIDTLYTKDFYPYVNEHPWRYIWGCKPLDDTIAFVVPLVLDGIVSLPEGVKQYVKEVKDGYKRWYGFKSIAYHSDLINIKSVPLEGKEMLKTTAGTFYSYKFCFEETVNNNSDIRKHWKYINNDIGLIKEIVDSGHYTLLNSVRK
jgi:hypothetical protein